MNFSWSEAQAALATSQFSRLDQLVDERIKIFNHYKRNLDRKNQFQLMHELDYCKQVFWLPFGLSKKICGEERKASFIQIVEKNGIQFRPRFIRSHKCRLH